MKQILITPEIRAMAKKYASNLFKDKRADFVQPIVGLKNLIVDLKEINGDLKDKDRFIGYLNLIIDKFEQLKDLTPSKFQEYKEEFDAVLNPDRLSSSIKVRSKDLPSNPLERSNLSENVTTFFSAIVDRMQFSSARLYLAPYMQEIGIYTCVYCNDENTIYSDASEEAYYHFDHFLPKDKYPFLCICFFNLYPCCSKCNGHKLNGKKGSFQLFEEGVDANDPFVFFIDRKQYQYHKPETLSVTFKSRNANDEAFCKEYDSVYRIRQIYNDRSKLVEFQKLLSDIDKHRSSYPEATDKSIKGIVNKETLFYDVLGISGDESIIFTESEKKLKIDTAKDAGLL